MSILKFVSNAEFDKKMLFGVDSTLIKYTFVELLYFKILTIKQFYYVKNNF